MNTIQTKLDRFREKWADKPHVRLFVQSPQPGVLRTATARTPAEVERYIQLGFNELPKAEHQAEERTKRPATTQDQNENGPEVAGMTTAKPKPKTTGRGRTAKAK